MDALRFVDNIDYWITFLNLSLCSSFESSYCQTGHGLCLLNKQNQSICVCSPCFTGKRCEYEISRNLWHLGMVHSSKIKYITSTDTMIQYCIGIFLILNGLLSLQTYLCRKIRQTNLGIYLIMLSIITIFFGISLSITPTILLYFEKLEMYYSFVDIICLYEKTVYSSVSPMYIWFIAAVAIERVLIECSINYGLHDSRRRSIKWSLIIIISSILSTFPNVFMVREKPAPILRLVYCGNFTPIGYILYATIRCIHLFVFYFIYILMNMIVISKLIRRRQRLVDNESLIDQIRLILTKHKDFFIPYLIQAICLLPNVILDYTMTCPTANSMFVTYIHLICNGIQIFAFAIIFYLYVCLSPIYLSIFWDSSPVGKCLRNINYKLQTIYRNRINNSSILLETYT